MKKVGFKNVIRVLCLLLCCLTVVINSSSEKIAWAQEQETMPNLASGSGGERQLGYFVGQEVEIRGEGAGRPQARRVAENRADDRFGVGCYSIKSERYQAANTHPPSFNCFIVCIITKVTPQAMPNAALERGQEPTASTPQNQPTRQEDIYIPTFYGKIFTDKGRQIAEGTWTNVNGERFEGRSEIASREGERTITRQGYLETATFKGKHSYTEMAPRNEATIVTDTKDGEECLAEGGIFKGKTIMSRELIMDSSQQQVIVRNYTFTKEGSLTTPMFLGTICYKETRREQNDPLVIEETKEGKKLLPTGGTFKGQMTMNKKGEETTITKKGYLDTPSFKGELFYERYSTTAAEQASIKEVKTGIEKLGEGLLGDGSTFQGTSTLTERKVAYPQDAVVRTLLQEGTWTIKGGVTLKGKLITTQQEDGRVEVIDERS